jgi:hypothetical protein
MRVLLSSAAALAACLSTSCPSCCVLRLVPRDRPRRFAFSDQATPKTFFFFQLHPSTNVTAALMLGTRAEPSARAVASRGTLDEVSILTRDIMPRWFLFAGFLFRRVVL